MPLTDKIVDHEQVYEEITKIYDLAEGIVDAIEAGGVVNPEQQIKIAERVIESAGQSGDELSETYVDYAERGFIVESTDAAKVEKAVRRIFTSIEDFNDSIDAIKSGDSSKELITIEELMSKIKFIQILGKDLPESKIQRSLRKKAIKLGLKYGGLLVAAVKRLGDHVLGLMHVFQSLGLGIVMNSIPNRQGWKMMAVAQSASVQVPVINRGDGPGHRF